MMFWKGFRLLAAAATVAAASACSTYPFEYQPYGNPHAHSKWHENEVSRPLAKNFEQQQ